MWPEVVKNEALRGDNTWPETGLRKENGHRQLADPATRGRESTQTVLSTDKLEDEKQNIVIKR